MSSSTKRRTKTRSPATRGSATATRTASVPAAEARRRQARRRLVLGVGAAVVAGVVALFVIARSSDSGSGGAGGPDFVVGEPGAGEAAPPIRLPSTGGGEWDLARDGAGQTTLLYFQEGVMCQPCWDQMRDIEADFTPFQELGIDEMVAITVDPLDVLEQKVADEGLRSQVLSDPDVSLGPSYTANQYGMMGAGMYGHTFIVVGPDGTIRWRGDYGGPPDHTMYVTPEALLDDLQASLNNEPAAAS